MYNIILKNIDNKYEYEELIKIFLNPADYRLFTDAESEVAEEHPEATIVFNKNAHRDKNDVKREIYENLSALTGKKPEWGILTGVRPVKLTGEMFAEAGDYDNVRRRLQQAYFLHPRKADLLIETLQYQQANVGKVPQDTVGVYIGIPFCPTRCLYCSFASNQVTAAAAERYLQTLLQEIAFCGAQMHEKGMRTESLYIGGGTPTSLNESQLQRLLEAVTESFDMSIVREFTVEAGRPDTINKEKLRILHDMGVDRISINPQSMKDKTLELIGRSHSAADIETAYKLARETGHWIINCDVIAGLPEEDVEDFTATIRRLTEMQFENITVHTLAVKRASRLIDIDKDFHYKQAQVVREQLVAGEKILRAAGYVPYYLYRQKHMAGAFENIGWCKPGTESVYNVRIMEEAQTIIALGAGGISKVYYPDENRLERVPNVTNYEIYIERFDEMLKRKENHIFQEEKTC